MATTILVDGNSIGYACFHGSAKLSSGNLQTQAVFGFIRTMRELKQRNRADSILVLWDGRAQFRYDIYPDYKSGRKSEDPKKIAEKEAYTAQIPYIKQAMTALGIAQMIASDREADDLAGTMVERLMTKPNAKVLLITGDRDWIQLIQDGVIWRDLRDDSRLISMANFTEKTGYRTPYAFLQGKVLQGDSSDGITGVGGIGEKGAMTFIAEHGSVLNFWKKCESGEYVPTKKAEISLYSGEGRKIFGRNMRLMQLIKPMPLDKSKLSVIKGNLNADDFADLCGELSFLSILKTLDNFLIPFQSNTPA